MKKRVFTPASNLILVILTLTSILIPATTFSQSTNDFPWLTDIISQEDCCTNRTISVFEKPSNSFVYIKADDSCDGGSKLYFEDGQCWCSDNDGSFCLMAYGLMESMGNVISRCETTITYDVFNQYPWLHAVASPSDCCQSQKIEVYETSPAIAYLYIAKDPMCSDGLGKLYLQDGTFLCMDSPNYSCRAAYGFIEDGVSTTWTCDATAAASQKIAQATLYETNSSGMSGLVTFTERNGRVVMQAQVSGLLPESIHAIHIHSIGDCTAPDGTSAGGHWNPTNETHGKWGDSEFHRGDIGNIIIGADGTGMITRETDLWCIGCGDPTKDIAGKGMIIHAGPDDFSSQPAGAAGPRIGCGVIENKSESMFQAKATIVATNESGMEGMVSFSEANGIVTMHANITNLSGQGNHAIHIHSVGDCTAADGTSAGGHWNPTNEMHGKWGDPEFHRGDIGNILINENGNGNISRATDLWCIGCGDPAKDIINKSIIVHAGPDDFSSQPSGAAGPRIGCAVITKK